MIYGNFDDMFCVHEGVFQNKRGITRKFLFQIPVRRCDSKRLNGKLLLKVSACWQYTVRL